MVLDFIYLLSVLFLTRKRRFPEAIEAGSDKIGGTKRKVPAGGATYWKWDGIMSGIFREAREFIYPRLRKLCK
jgi:hypothetical protein